MIWEFFILAAIVVGIAACSTVTVSPTEEQTIVRAISMPAVAADTSAQIIQFKITPEQIDQFDTLIYEHGRLILTSTTTNFDFRSIRIVNLHISPIADGTETWIPLYVDENHPVNMVDLTSIDLTYNTGIDVYAKLKEAVGNTGAFVEIIVTYGSGVPIPAWSGIISVTLTGSLKLV